jgi:flagellar biosynthesis protein FlhF
MRLKTIHARNMQEAMELVREQMGAEAIIVATHEDEGTRGVRVTAASDAEDRHISEEERAVTFETLQLVGNALDDHGTPPELVDRILNSVAAQAVSDPHMALAGALQSIFEFLPLPVSGSQSRPIMLIGPPGGGKTSAAAKMAARAVIAGHSIRLITTDTVRAQGIEQLESYATRLGLEVVPAPDPLALIEAIENAHPEDLIVIDTMGVNPYSPEDLGKLVDLTSAIAVEPILVLTAGRDPIEATEIVKAYGEVAPSRMLVTGLDMVRRLGSVLASIDTSGLAFSDVSPSPNIVNGMRPMNQMSLSRLLLPSEPAQTANLAPARSSLKQISNPSNSPQESPLEETVEDEKLAPTGSN